LILTEGGKNTGFGHITRCEALYQGFKKVGSTSTIIVNGDNTVKNLLKKTNYCIFNWIIGKKRIFKMVSAPDVVIIDSYLVEKPFYENIFERITGKLVVIDDHNRLEYPKGILINPSIYGDTLNYPLHSGTIYLLGAKYIILRKEFWNNREKCINKNIKNILVTFGGMDHSAFTRKIIAHLKNKFQFNLYVVGLEQRKLDAKNMLGLMLRSDICISGGGQTISELAKIGVPAIGICLHESQKRNLETWHKKGFVEYIGQCNDKNLPERIANAIEKLVPHKERTKRSEIGRHYVDGKGVERLTGILMGKKLNGT